MNTIVLLLIIVLFSALVNFIFTWIKVKIFMWGAGIKGNSFRYTISYMLAKGDMKNIFKES